MSNNSTDYLNSLIGLLARLCLGIQLFKESMEKFDPSTTISADFGIFGVPSKKILLK